MNRKAASAYAQRDSALRTYLARGGSSADPASLSRSYGLPVPDVERIIRSMGNAR